MPDTPNPSAAPPFKTHQDYLDEAAQKKHDAAVRKEAQEAERARLEAEETAAASARATSGYAQTRPTFDFSSQEGLFGDIGAAQSQMFADLQGYKGALDTGRDELVSRLGAYEGALDRAPALVRRDVSSEAARGMAAAMGQAGGMPIGGGSAAAMRAQGRTAGDTTARIFADLLPGIEQAKFAAGGQVFAEALPAMELAKSTAADKELQVLLDEQTRAEAPRAGMQIAVDNVFAIEEQYLIPTDDHPDITTEDKKNAAEAYLALAEASGDPKVAAFYLAKADQIMGFDPTATA